MPSEAKLQKKGEYFVKLVTLLDTYKRILLVGCDNIGSKHMQDIRTALRGEAVLLMGKKTMMRKAIRDHLDKNPALEALLPAIHGNVGFVFTNKDLAGIREKLTKLKVNAPAKTSAIAPNDVIVPAGPTGMDPTQTSFLQALNIASKINKGQVEIVSDVTLLKKGDKVGQSEATLLGKLNIKPFIYGLLPQVVYDNGLVYDQKVLDMSDEDVFARLRKGIQAVAAVGLAIGYPTAASVPHSVIRGFKNLVALAMETTYSFKQADLLKEAMKNPVAAAAAPAAPAKEEKKESKKEAKKEEKKEEPVEEEADMGLDLFA